MIEHVTLAEGEMMLCEAFRILKPGGRIRIVTPDLDKLSNMYSVWASAEAQKYYKWHHQECGDKSYPSTICLTHNNVNRNWGHKFIYDEEMLEIALTRVGFLEIKRYGWGETEDPRFENISQRKNPGSEYETLVLRPPERVDS